MGFQRLQDSMASEFVFDFFKWRFALRAFLSRIISEFGVGFPGLRCWSHLIVRRNANPGPILTKSKDTCKES